MARKTDGEWVEELQRKAAELDKANALLAQRVEAAERAVRETQDSQRETERQLAALRLDYETKLADLRRAHEAETKLLRQQVEEFKQEQLRWGARLWQIAIALVVVVVGAALTAYLGLKK